MFARKKKFGQLLRNDKNIKKKKRFKCQNGRIPGLNDDIKSKLFYYFFSFLSQNGETVLSLF